jgi:hypothetical protein
MNVLSKLSGKAGRSECDMTSEEWTPMSQLGWFTRQQANFMDSFSMATRTGKVELLGRGNALKK